jgi:hypothetical protein
MPAEMRNGRPSAIPSSNERAPFGAHGVSVAAQPGTSRVKGVALRNFEKLLVEFFDARTAAAVIEALPNDARDALKRHAVVSGGWYPLDWYKAMHAAARQVTGSGPALAWRIGRESTKLDLTGVYRVFLRMLSPGFVLSASSRIFSTYYSPGKMRLVESREGAAHVAFDACEGFDANIWQDVLGGCEVALELTGANNVRVHMVRGGKDGDVSAEAVARWT